MPFFNDVVTTVQPILMSQIDNCNESRSKNLLKQTVLSLVSEVPESEAKTSLTQFLNKFT